MSSATVEPRVRRPRHSLEDALWVARFARQESVEDLVNASYRLRAAADWADTEGSATRYADRAEKCHEELAAREVELCGCEHIEHESPGSTGAHYYMAAAAGERRADYVGRVCDTCADGHLAEYVLPR